MVKLFYGTYISVDIAYYEIFHAYVGKGGISISTPTWKTWTPTPGIFYFPLE